MNIDVKHRGTTHRLTVDLNATLDQVRHELYAVTGVPAERQKLLHKSLMRIDWAHGEGARLTVGKVFAGGSRTATTSTSTATSTPATSTPATSTVTSTMITLIGSTDAEIQAVHQKDTMLAARTPLPSLRPQRPSTVVASSSNTRRFSRFDTLPYPSAERALQLLHRLADDRGIRGIMLQRAWNVGLLHELCPRQRPDILGYNQNAGQSIALRLRTDDLTGFRHYESVRKVLLHELAHMVHGEHDHRFWALYRELERDVVRLDWSAHGGRLLTSAAGGDFYQSQEGQEDLDDTARRTTFTGGVYRLGTLASAERQQATPMRQLLADAAILRLTAEERAMAEACGSGGHGHAHGGASSTDELSKDNPSTDETQQQNH